MKDCTHLVAAVEPPDGDGPTTYEYALHLVRKGLPVTVCSAGSKTPVGDDWPSGIRTPDQIDDLFERRPDRNVGIVLGPTSGIIDIELDGEDRDGHLPELFDGELPPVTPTFESRRGRHRLFAWHDDLAVLDTAKLRYPHNQSPVEVRLGIRGAQTLLPPSVVIGATGPEYRRWLRGLSLDECLPAPLPDSSIKKLLALGEERRSSHRDALQSVGLCLCVNSDSLSPATLAKIERAIEMTLPTSVGFRHEAEFKFARHLRGIPELAMADEASVKPFVHQWWALGNEQGVIGSDWQTTWNQFVCDWPNVRKPIGTGNLDIAFANALAKPLPPEGYRYDEDLPRLRKLVALCCELQRVKGLSEPFFLDCRNAGRLLGVGYRQANKMIHRLISDGILRPSDKNERKAHKAFEYWYVALQETTP